MAVNIPTRVTYNATHSPSDFVAISRTCFGTDDEGPSVPDDASSDHELIRGLMVDPIGKWVARTVALFQCGNVQHLTQSLCLRKRLHVLKTRVRN